MGWTYQQLICQPIFIRDLLLLKWSLEGQDRQRREDETGSSADSD